MPFRREAADLERLTAAQREQALYSTAVAGYIGWLAPQLDRLHDGLPEKRDRLRAELQAGGHGRLPEAVANLVMGLRAGLRFALEVGVLADGQAANLADEGLAIFRELASRQEKRLQDREPTRRFATILVDLFAQRRVYLKDRVTGGAPRDATRWGWFTEPPSRDDGPPGHTTRPSAEALGWIDQEALYLLPEAYFGPVARACRETGEVFPVRERTLRDHLARVGALERGEKLTRPIWAEGKTVRVLSIRRGVFDRLAEVEEPSKDDEELPFDD